MTDPTRSRQIARCPAWTALLLALLLAACMGEDAVDPTPTAEPSVTSSPRPASPTASATPGRAFPSMPVVTLTPEPSPTTAPSATATATGASGTPSATREPAPIPAGQQEDLPDVELAYAIEAALRDVDSGIVDALSVTTVTNRAESALERLYFRVAPAHFNAFSLNSLTRDGAAVEPAGSDNGTTLEVALDPPLEAGATTELRFDFVVALRDTGDGYASITRDGPVLRLGFWYPMLSNDAGYPLLLDPSYTLSADYTVSFTAPAGVVVAASGELTGPPEATQDGVRHTYTLANGRDFALMLSREYEVDERTTASGIVVRQYTIPAEYGDDSDATRAQIRNLVFAVAELSLGDYAANIGPYPWPSLALVEAGPGLGGGIEYSALTIISYDSGALVNLVAHEIAHMWFYAAIGTRTQDDPWIDEGAATFLSNGLLTGDYAVSSDRGTINYVAPLNSSVFDLTGFNGGEWITAVYTQGGSFYADTYVAMGDIAFWEAMREIYASQLFGIATPWEILTTFQEHSDAGLLPVYERYFAYEWLDEIS